MQMKKILSIFLVALMCLGAFPASVFAADVAMPACPECQVNTNVTATGEVNKDATCTEAAGEWFVCSNNDKHAYNTPKEFIRPYAGSVAHHSNPDHVTAVAYKDSTCVEVGTEAYWYCDVCETYYKSAAMEATNAFANAEETVIAKKTTHTIDEDVYTWKDGIAPDCGVHGGTKVFACQVEGCTYTETEDVAATEHVWKYFSHADVADCLTDTVVTEKCELCGDTREVLGRGWKHSLVKTDAVRKNCTTAGNKVYYTCVLCGDYFMDVAEDAEGAKWMTYSYVVKENIQGVDRDVTYYVDVCVAQVAKDAWVVPASHEPVKMGGVAPDCLNEGSEVYYDCAECDKYFSDKACTIEIEKDSWIIDATGHNVTFHAQEDATCATAGKKAYYQCNDCNRTFAPVTGFVAQNAVYSEAPLKIDGEVINVAVVEIFVCEIIPAKGHEFGEVVPANTKPCTAHTVAYKTCSVCELNYAADAGDYEAEALETIYVTVKVPNPAFNPLEPVSTTNPEFVVAGTTGALDLDVQHNWVYKLDKITTCLMDGVITWHCADCDEYTGGLIVYKLDALAHNMIDTEADNWYVPAIAGACIANGKHAYVQCNGCNEYLRVLFDDEGEAYIDFAAGSWNSTDAAIFTDSKVPTVHANTGLVVFQGREATCTLYGHNTYYLCLSCGKYYQTVSGVTENLPVTEDGQVDITAVDGYLKHSIKTWVEAKEAAYCGDTSNPAYCVCSCGKIYGVKVVDDETVADYTVIYAQAPITTREHVYTAVAATFDCFHDGKMAHYVCNLENCGKLFLYFAPLNAYVEVTEDKLAVEATGQHKWSEIRAAVDCTEGKEGVAGLEKCDVCKLERYIDPHVYIDRDYLTIEGTNEATCTATGHYALKCHWCQTYQRTEDGKGYAIYESPKKLHTDYGTPTYVPAKAESCFEAGNKAYYVCNGCGYKFPTADLVHTDAFDIVVGEPDTDVEVVDGKVNVSLANPVTEIYKQNWEVIPAEHHGVTDFIPAAEDILCGDVYADQEYCSICKKYSKDGFKTYQDTPYITTDATKHTGVLAANGDYVDTSCLAAGHKMTYTCQGECGKTYIKDGNNYVLATAENVVIEQLSHNGVFMPATAPTCTTQGWKAWYQVCTNGCNKIYGAKDPLATDANATEPDTNVVYDLFGNMDMIIPLLGHVQNADNTVASVPSVCSGFNTVTDGNIAYYTCDRCNKMFADGDTGYLAVELNENTIKAVWYQELVHYQTSTMVPGSKVLTTCTEEGYYALVCTCGYTYYQFSAPVGHDIVLMNKDKINATCSEYGLEEFYFCANCKTSYKDRACTQVWKSYMEMLELDAMLAAYNDACIEPTGKHVNIVDGEKVEIVPNCYNGEFILKDGKWIEEGVDYICDECGKDFKDPHKWTSGHVGKNCSYPESNYQVCARCHVIDENTRVVIGEKADPADPDYDKYHGTLVQNTTEGTKCTDANRFYDVCPLCNKQVGDAYADPAGHDYDEYALDDATCGANGTSYQRCTKCGDEIEVTITAPDDHKFTGAWTNVEGKEFDYTTDKAEVRYCDYGCGTPTYRAHQDVHFAVELDSGVRASAALVNSGRLAVTVKLSAYDKTARAFKFSFMISDNLTLDADATEWHALADKFTAQLSGVAMDANVPGQVNIVVARMIGETALDADETDDVVYIQDEALVTLYFDIADDADGASVVIYDLTTVEMQNAKGAVDTSDFTVGADKIADVARLGDGNVFVPDETKPEETTIGDGAIDFSDLYAMIDLIMNNTDDSYAAQLDFDKDGSHTAADLNAMKTYIFNGDYDALIHPAA